MIQETITRESTDFAPPIIKLFEDAFGVRHSNVHQLLFDVPSERNHVSGIKILDQILNINKYLFRQVNNTFERVSEEYDNDEEFYNRDWSSFVRILIDHKLVIYVTEHRNSVNYYFLADESSSELIQKFSDELKIEFKINKKEKPTNINIICTANGRIFNEAYPIAISDSNIDFEDCYNDDLITVDSIIMDKLSKKNSKGIILLHGEVGSGKTTYLRRLIKNVNKKMIYLPPELAHDLSSPNFIPYLMENSNSILFIEDAENILRSREAGGSQAVSNLLNTTDGILSDALRIQIVCTFNCHKDDIDKALLRPGRLIAEYRFDKLTSAKSERLIRKLYNESELELIKAISNKPLNAERTLAEIFNLRETLPTSIEPVKLAFGFNHHERSVA